MLTASVLAIPAALWAQRTIAPVSCSFDTLAHTDTLHLEFSLRVFRGNDTIPDPGLTTAFAEAVQPQFTAPPSIGELFAPNSYYRWANGYSTFFGTMQLELAPDGRVTNLSWYVTGHDVATDGALERAMRKAIGEGEVNRIAVALAAKNTVALRLQFFATNGTLPRAAIALLRVPMIRLDSLPRRPRNLVGALEVTGATAWSLSDPSRTEVEYTIDASGHPVAGSLQLIFTSSPVSADFYIRGIASTIWVPASAGGCPVASRIHYVIEPRPKK